MNGEQHSDAALRSACRALVEEVGRHLGPDEAACTSSRSRRSATGRRTSRSASSPTHPIR